MKSLIEHARTFPSRIHDQKEEFALLAQGQRPQALFISCSDSRVVPALFTGARPGDLFELRTAGNIVPRHRPQAACGVAGSLEFALQVLQVPDIVVCGHSHCGAVQALMRAPSPRNLPLLRRWLNGAGYQRGSQTPWQLQGLGEDPGQVTQRHVLTQLEHLKSYPSVARRVTSGRLRLHAWFYTVETGEVLARVPGTSVFKPL
ncbi:carbonic anhydrase [Streptomyces sp. JS01]|uniref:Carbonic anhydrase n=2 Tax=Streptomyces TaxID=1883 RepID=A0A1E7LSD1_9ACTN|nr:MULTISPECIES: carbonic anhydrase [Streptomyces]KAA6203925.1 carbonic anhydrase [Streptomyces parvus]KFK88105.1 carbonic anhydrase [Streptomyces sp. JS01]OEV19090.1 carbonic anhydrase [Streptomyces nanshensis]UCA51616.1 carbonic anhydrase [Streptomyces sp. WA6-1-16]GGS40256.1 carbonic anhydrase [Streptomyces parvus]